MEFSLEQVEQAVVFARDVAVLVNVPEPARVPVGAAAIERRRGARRSAVARQRLRVRDSHSVYARC